MKTQFGLGVLSFPSVFDTLGMIPGVIMLLVIGCIATWSSYMVGVFKVNHREVYGVDDVGRLMFCRVGREVLAAAFLGRMLPCWSGPADRRRRICAGYWLRDAELVDFSQRPL